MKPKRRKARVRKPMPFKGWHEKWGMAGIEYKMGFFRYYDYEEVFEIISWLTRYIAWAEQERRRGK